MNQVLFLILTLLATSLAEPTYASNDPQDEIKKLQEMKGVAEEKSDVTPMRAEVLSEAAFVLAIQAGVHWRYTKRLKELEAMSDELDRIFNFSPLMLEGEVLPPVIVESGPGFRIENDQTATSVIKHYKIANDAKFVSMPPNWRTYLLVPIAKADNINHLILPKTREEKKYGMKKYLRDFMKESNKLMFYLKPSSTPW